LGGIDERPWVGIAVFDLVFFFSFCFEIGLLILALRWFFSFLFFSSYFFVWAFRIEVFFFFWLLFKNSFSSHTFSTVYYFSSFLDKDIYLWRVPQVGPFTAAFLRVFCF